MSGQRQKQGKRVIGNLNEMPQFLSSLSAASIAVSTTSVAPYTGKHHYLYPCFQGRYLYCRRQEEFSFPSVRSFFSYAGRRPIIRMDIADRDAVARTQTSISSNVARKHALISLSDKRDVDILGRGLQGLGYSIVSTGGTTKALEQAGITVIKVEEVTSFPEMLGGRVKTTHPNINGGILARRDRDQDQDRHMEDLYDHGIRMFDIVVVNLYPFYEMVTSSSEVTFEDGIENIDIGGHTLIHAAAKNHMDVLVIVDPKDYSSLIEFLRRKEDNQQFRRELARKAFQYLYFYNLAISEWLWKQSSQDKFPLSLTVPLTMKSTHRCGENPHQKAEFYNDKCLSVVNADGDGTAIQHHGKEGFDEALQ